MWLAGMGADVVGDEEQELEVKLTLPWWGGEATSRMQMSRTNMRMHRRRRKSARRERESWRRSRNRRDVQKMEEVEEEYDYRRRMRTGMKRRWRSFRRRVQGEGVGLMIIRGDEGMRGG